MKPSTRSRWRALASLDGLIPEEVGRRLCDLAAEVPADQHIVELGSFKGKSTAYLAEGARLGNGARAWAIDPWDLPLNENGRHGFAEPETRRTFERQLRSLDLRGAVTMRRAFSVEAAQRWRGNNIGMLYIDADHSYESVLEDVVAWYPHLVPGATVAFDDYGTPRNPGVKAAVDHLVHEGHIDFLDLSTPPLAVAVACAQEEPP